MSPWVDIPDSALGWSVPISASNWAVTSVPSIHREGPRRPVCLHTISALDTIHFAVAHCTTRRGPPRFPRVRQWTGRSSRSFPALPSVWFYLCKYLTHDCRRHRLDVRRDVTLETLTTSTVMHRLHSPSHHQSVLPVLVLVLNDKHKVVDRQVLDTQCVYKEQRQLIF